MSDSNYHPKASTDTNPGEGAAKQSGKATSSLCEVGIGGENPLTTSEACPHNAPAQPASVPERLANELEHIIEALKSNGFRVRPEAISALEDFNRKPKPASMEKIVKSALAEHYGDSHYDAREVIKLKGIITRAVEEAHKEGWYEARNSFAVTELELNRKLQQAEAELNKQAAQIATQADTLLKVMGNLAKAEADKKRLDWLIENDKILNRESIDEAMK
jgi:hypothetical protein